MGTLYWMVNYSEPKRAKTCNPAEDQSTQVQQCIVRVWMIMIRRDQDQEPSARQAESCLVSLLQGVVQVVSWELSNELFLMLLG